MNAAVRAAWHFLNGWADRIFVVSLRRAEGRRALIRERLAGLDYSFVDAFDKLDLDRARLTREGVFDERRTPRAYRYKAEMPLGHIGCSLSHRALYEQIVGNGWRRVVVFEDDVVPVDSALVHLPDALQQLPEDWELCYLGYWRNAALTVRDRVRQALYVALSPFRLVCWRPGEAMRLLPRRFSPNLLAGGRHLCTHAYAITAEGARKLLAAQTPVAFNADQLLAFLVLRGRISAYATIPKLFDQDAIAGNAPPAGAPASYIHG
jgi:glycosyl transferase family 25